MEKSYNQFFEILILLLFSMAFSSMFYVGIPGKGGVVLAIAVLVLSALFLFVEKVAAVPMYLLEHHTPLLFDAVLLIGGIYLIVAEGGRLNVFYALIASAGLVCMIYWVADKKYEGKSVKTILADELHILPPAAEIALVVFYVLEIAIKNEVTSGVKVLTIITFSIDAASQVLLKRISRFS